MTQTIDYIRATATGNISVAPMSPDALHRLTMLAAGVATEPLFRETPKHREVVRLDPALFDAMRRAGITRAGDGDRLTDAQFELLRQQSNNTWDLTKHCGAAGILPASVKPDRLITI
jgi:hypothetical protein